ncbi:LysR substrate-binding domain-containing protein [Xylophilus rhododendri]|nr:LysR substrate-binding domain-containing protein [Xylophilus rhododendri]
MSELHAFVAVVRTGSFSRAATELLVTQGAISRAVARMESHYGKQLLQRDSHQLGLTPAGRQFLDEIQEPLAAIEAASVRLRLGNDGGHDITAAVVPTLAHVWLIPRLAAFHARYPDVQLRFVPYRSQEDFSGSTPDCAILTGLGEEQWPALACEYLIGREVVPVCSPARAAARHEQGRWQTPDELAGEPLLYHTTSPGAWTHWLRAAGARATAPNLRQSYDLVAGVIQAAIADFGIGLVPRFLVQAELDAGRLAVPFDLPILSQRGYYFCTPAHRRHQPGVAAFRSWLIETAKGEIAAMAMSGHGEG